MNKEKVKQEVKVNQEKKEEGITRNKTPIIETRMGLSQDKKWFIQQTIISEIKPVNYIKKVLEGSN